MCHTSPCPLHRPLFLAAAASLLMLLAAPHVPAVLPEIPRGVAVINTVDGEAFEPEILGNPDVDVISLFDPWTTIQPDPETYDWSYLNKSLAKIQNAGKSALLRIGSMGGSQSLGGNTPDWVFQAMAVDPASILATPGTTYSFIGNDGIIRCIPVFWQPVYLAKKKALIAMAGAELAGKSALKVFVVSFANCLTEDWNVPHDDKILPSQVDLWQNAPDDPLLPGAGYTTQKMVDAAIHYGDATFNDGSVGGTTLTSLSATFTQADIGCVISGETFQSDTHISAWISPTQVTLDKPLLQGRGRKFRVLDRPDGLIDVAMAAFPNQYISVAVGGNGPTLDDPPGEQDAKTYLARTVDELAQTRYPGRYIVQRNNVSTAIPPKGEATEVWVLLAKAADSGNFTAGQALTICWGNVNYKMNSGDNCDHDANCRPVDGMCEGDCALYYDQILQRSADHLLTYSPSYYEIYPVDARNLPTIVTYIHNLLNP